MRAALRRSSRFRWRRLVPRIDAKAFPADITNYSAWAAAPTDAQRHFGSIDVLEYSPAPSLPDLTANPLVTAVDVTVDSVRPQLEFYLFGGITAVQAVLPGMLTRGSGTIIQPQVPGQGR